LLSDFHGQKSYGFFSLKTWKIYSKGECLPPGANTIFYLEEWRGEKRFSPPGDNFAPPPPPGDVIAFRISWTKTARICIENVENTFCVQLQHWAQQQSNLVEDGDVEELVSWRLDWKAGLQVPNRIGSAAFKIRLKNRFHCGRYE
jgi:hypothetical protein